MSDTILEMAGITKIYPNGFVANKGVSLRVQKGEIHALVGENGAGKTTLMKILFGMEDYQEGEIRIKGKAVTIQNPLHAIACGVGMVHQHFMQIPRFSVAENIVLGIEPTKGPSFDKEAANRMAQDIADKYHFDICVTDTLEDLSVGVRQKVELLKALIRGVDVLILDEPTAVLTPQETEELFVQLKLLKQQGISIVFISHKLEEVMKLCDNLTVLRRGRCVATEAVCHVDEAGIARLMVGRDVTLNIEKDAAAPEETVLKVENLIHVNSEERSVVNGVSFSVRAGEVVGVAGVEGNGQKEIADIISGMLPLLQGEVQLLGNSIRGCDIDEIRRMGLAHISDDRMKNGCAPDLSIRDNILSTRLNRKEFHKGPFLDRKRIDAFVDLCIEEYQILCDSRSSPIRLLSGGNIQKVIVAREFTSGARLIVANEPTRGIDVGTTEMIRKTIVRKARQERVATFLVSSDMNELLEVSDRLLVVRKGKIVAHFTDMHAVVPEVLGEYMLGVRTMTRDQMGDVG